MRQEIEDLWTQAQEDLVTAEGLITIERYYASVCYSHQAAEEALKALHLETLRRPLYTHNLQQIAQAVEASDDIARAAASLTPGYIISRYPNAAGGVPARLFDKEDAGSRLDLARRVLDWVRSRLPQV